MASSKVTVGSTIGHPTPIFYQKDSSDGNINILSNSNLELYFAAQ